MPVVFPKLEGASEIDFASSEVRLCIRETLKTNGSPGSWNRWSKCSPTWSTQQQLVENTCQGVAAWPQERNGPCESTSAELPSHHKPHGREGSASTPVSHVFWCDVRPRRAACGALGLHRSYVGDNGAGARGSPNTGEGKFAQSIALHSPRETNAGLRVRINFLLKQGRVADSHLARPIQEGKATLSTVVLLKRW